MEHAEIPLNFTPTDDLGSRRDVRNLAPRNEVSSISFFFSDVQSRKYIIVTLSSHRLV
jgi:hypothetical protein